jgi:ABC-type spermidine/putrescine transport system permease subunit II
LSVPTGGLILACVFLGALLAAYILRRFFVGMSVAFIIVLLSFVLYTLACLAVAKYLLEPALDLDLSLMTDSLVENVLVGLALLVLTPIVGAPASALGVLMRRFSTRQS